MVQPTPLLSLLSRVYGHLCAHITVYGTGNVLIKMMSRPQVVTDFVCFGFDAAFDKGLKLEQSTCYSVVSGLTEMWVKEHEEV